MFLLIEKINITEFEEIQIRVLALDVMLQALQTAVKQCLTHHIKIRT